VVDDEPDFCAVVRELLRRDQIDVVPAHNAEEAISLLKRETPDLIMTDVLMPGSDGLTFLRRLRSDPAWSRIPALVVSACALHETRSAAFEAGADAFLSKPFSICDLRAAIERHLDG
jgi:CheY-like chemotaxis protein